MGPERRILPGEFELLGLHQSGCSHGPGSGKSGGIWCAFSRKVGPAPAELWVLDVVQATSTTVACDGSSAACLKLSDELFTLLDGKLRPSHTKGRRLGGQPSPVPDRQTPFC